MTNSIFLCHNVTFQTPAQIQSFIDLFTSEEYTHSMGYESSLAVYDDEENELTLHYMTPLADHKIESLNVGCGVMAHSETFTNSENQQENHIILQAA